ncbi:MAG: endonuclease III [Chloroflexota bacterium]
MLFDFDVELRAKAQEILKRELAAYGEFSLEQHRDRDIFPRLIKTMLSHRTTHADERAAYNNMWNHYGDWDKIRTADPAELTQLLAPSRYPEAKARNIQKTLTVIYEEHGAYTIDFLHEWPTQNALEWLLALPGVGLKTATLLLLFYFRRPVMPVDTHVHRVSKRTGLIDSKTSAEKAHRRLLELLPADPHTLYNFHRATLTHGQRYCHYYNPKCAACPLQNLCDAYAGKNDAIAHT